MSIAPRRRSAAIGGRLVRIKLTEPFYVGLGVCAHDNNALEKAVFSNVEIKQAPQPILESTLETIAIASKDRSVVYTKRAHFEAPNWSRDGKYFFFNQGGRIYKLPVTGGEPQVASTPALPRAATTITASRPTARCWSSAINRRSSAAR